MYMQGELKDPATCEMFYNASYFSKQKWELKEDLPFGEDIRKSLFRIEEYEGSGSNMSMKQLWVKVTGDIVKNLKAMVEPHNKSLDIINRTMNEEDRKKDIEETSICRGVIDNTYLNTEQMDKNALIFVARQGTNIKGFAVCRFKSHKIEGGTQFYLYIDVICSLTGEATRKLWEKIYCFVKLNGKVAEEKRQRSAGEEGKTRSQKKGHPFLSGIQLSALTYVIGYYFHKGFRFYKIDTMEEENEEDGACNDMAEKFKNLTKGPPDEGRQAVLDVKDIWGRFTRNDDRNFDFLYKTEKFDDKKAMEEAKNSESDDERGLWHYNNLEMERVKVRNKTNKVLPAEEARRGPGTAELIVDWISGKHKGCASGDHSVEFSISNRPKWARGRANWLDEDKKILTREFVEGSKDGRNRLDAGSEGWTMFLKNDDFECKDTKGTNVVRSKKFFIEYSAGGKRTKKRTKKRALKKRHRKKTKRRVKKKKRTRRRKRKKTKKRY